MHKELLWSLYRNHYLKKNIVCTVSFVYRNHTPWGVAPGPLPVTHGVLLIVRWDSRVSRNVITKKKGRDCFNVAVKLLASQHCTELRLLFYSSYLKKHNLFYILDLFILISCVCTCTTCIRCLVPMEATRRQVFWNWSCEPPHGCWEPSLRPLQE